MSTEPSRTASTGTYPVVVHAVDDEGITLRVLTAADPSLEPVVRSHLRDMAARLHRPSVTVGDEVGALSLDRANGRVRDSSLEDAYTRGASA